MKPTPLTEPLALGATGLFRPKDCWESQGQLAGEAHQVAEVRKAISVYI